MLQTPAKVAPLVSRHIADIARLAEAHRVAKLELFGSAANDALTPGSDLDLLVVFEPLSVGAHGEHYFGLKHALEDLLGRTVDLLELEAIDNPYFLRSTEPERTLLYAT